MTRHDFSIIQGLVTARVKIIMSYYQRVEKCRMSVTKVQQINTYFGWQEKRGTKNVARNDESSDARYERGKGYFTI